MFDSRLDSLKNSDRSWHVGQKENLAMFSICDGLCIRTDLNAQQQDEKDALVDFFNAMNGNDWIRNYGWLQGQPCFDLWFGIECNVQGYVTKIYLPENHLVGVFSDGILSRLTSLRVFHIASISIATTKTIESPLMLSRQNRVSGSLADLAGLSTLQLIEISGNLFDTFPDISNANLELVDLSWNGIATFPDLSGSVNVKFLDLSNNLIDDTFPEWVCTMLEIRQLNFGNNTITGEIPNCITNINPFVFDISSPRPSAVGGSLTGSFPEGIIDSWTNIEKEGYISMYRQNHMTGKIAELCVDVLHCFSYMYQTHPSLSWISSGDQIPAVVNSTLALINN